MVRPSASAGAAATPSAAKGFGSAKGGRSITSSFGGVLVLVIFVWLGVLCSRSREMRIKSVLLFLFLVPHMRILFIWLVL